MDEIAVRGKIPALSVGPFVVTRTGLIVERVPEWEEWQAFFDGMQKLADFRQWNIGDALTMIDVQYGEAAAQLTADYPEHEYDALRDYRYVAEHVEFAVRTANLKFGHHKIVAPLEPAEQAEWLEKAERNEWTVKELRVALRDDKLLNRPPLPDGIYDVVYADPPWQYGPENPQGGPASLHYPSMSLEELCKMSLPKLADDAVLFLWVTNPMLKKAFIVVESWGFDYKTNMVWIKTDLKRPGSGYYVRGRHEFIFIATRGSFTPRNVHASPIGSYFEAPLREHSAKPRIMYEWIETLYPDCSYIELFARNNRDGWEAWGNELPR